MILKMSAPNAAKRTLKVWVDRIVWIMSGGCIYDPTSWIWMVDASTIQYSEYEWWMHPRSKILNMNSGCIHDPIFWIWVVDASTTQYSKFLRMPHSRYNIMKSGRSHIQDPIFWILAYPALKIQWVPIHLSLSLSLSLSRKSCRGHRWVWDPCTAGASPLAPQICCCEEVSPVKRLHPRAPTQHPAPGLTGQRRSGGTDATLLSLSLYIYIYIYICVLFFQIYSSYISQIPYGSPIGFPEKNQEQQNGDISESNESPGVKHAQFN